MILQEGDHFSSGHLRGGPSCSGHSSLFFLIFPPELLPNVRLVPGGGHPH
ncbi:hypothetical protein NDU88_001448 [Pleurodeles waltl]|uniref:Uncharacterized protein n=1 Tax=Pleurodeles waltl TaxID=8319 RepID=A0AAV7VB11_PLEWA|nr:hypothetical protein NDU88_001448 [Pleurodeles waltl]